MVYSPPFTRGVNIITVFPTVVTKSTNPATVFVTNFSPESWLPPPNPVVTGPPLGDGNEPSGEDDAVTRDGVTVLEQQK